MFFCCFFFKNDHLNPAETRSFERWRHVRHSGVSPFLAPPKKPSRTCFVLVWMNEIKLKRRGCKWTPFPHRTLEVGQCKPNTNSDYGGRGGQERMSPRLPVPFPPLGPDTPSQFHSSFFFRARGLAKGLTHDNIRNPPAFPLTLDGPLRTRSSCLISVFRLIAWIVASSQFCIRMCAVPSVRICQGSNVTQTRRLPPRVSADEEAWESGPGL